jgi:hypothetical protein
MNEPASCWKEGAIREQNAFPICLLTILLGFVLVETLTATKPIVLTELMVRPGWEESGNFLPLD